MIRLSDEDSQIVFFCNSSGFQEYPIPTASNCSSSIQTPSLKTASVLIVKMEKQTWTQCTWTVELYWNERVLEVIFAQPTLAFPYMLMLMMMFMMMMMTMRLLCWRCNRMCELSELTGSEWWMNENGRLNGNEKSMIWYKISMKK